MKICYLCNIEKSLEEFYKDSRHPDGKEKRCRECVLKMRTKNYYKNHEVNREKARIKANNFRKNNKGYQRKYDLKRTYGITEEDYEKMLKEQNYGCKICNSKDPKGKTKWFNVDHCHNSGQVRGLLCTGCNLGLGAFKDNIEFMEAAIKYLKSQVK